MTCGTCLYFNERPEATADGECLWGKRMAPFWADLDGVAYVDRKDGEDCAAYSARKNISKTRTYTRGSDHA